jgi:hypothetical protein
MKRTILICTLAALSLAPSAHAADQLGLNKAKSATARYAAQKCEKDPDCVKSDARYCDRQNDWKLICDAFMIRRVDTDRVQCRQQVVVSASPGSPSALKLNPRALRCDG